MASAAVQPHERDAPRMIVAGATGFAGALAAQLIWRHPGFELVGVTGRSESGRQLEDLYPRYRVPLEIRELDAVELDGIDAAIVAYPHAAAAPTVAMLRERAIRVVDLSADFRLRSLATYEQWYGEHPRPELIDEAAYGLTELHREAIAGAGIVANPGCYPTASLLALAPLARAGLIADVVIDAKQGISGAGRAFDDTTHLSMAGENILPYKVAAHRHTPEIEEQLRALHPGLAELRVQFQAHLVPLDQGELASCYVTPTRTVAAVELRDLFASAYADEPFVEVAGEPPGTRDVLATNFCRIFAAADAHTGKLVLLSAIDNLWKGTSSQAVQNLNVMFGLPEASGLRMSAAALYGDGSAGSGFFRSRWVPAPAHVRDLGADPQLPGGFRAAGVAAGIKQSGRTDLGLLVCDAPEPTSAARFTDERHSRRAGAADARSLPPARAARGARELGLRQRRHGRARSRRRRAHAGRRSARRARRGGPGGARLTGGISHLLPVDSMLQGILRARAELSAAGAGSFQQAIETTDRFEKRASLELQLPSGTVRLSAQCKGAGMISPAFATMLCFVESDAALSRETADLLLGVCVKRSFDRVSVDGQLSTNDTAILMCSGASGVRIAPESEDELRFGEALDALLRQLAIMLVADGEGAERIARVVVRGGSDEAVEGAARAVANSPLVKAALHGGDPNWGRIVQSVGASLPGTAPLPVDVAIEGKQVCVAGAAIAYDEEDLARAVSRPEVEYEVGLPGEGAETELFFSDLSHEYVTVNADYTT